MNRPLLHRKRTWFALAAATAAALAILFWPEISRLCARIHWADIDHAVRAAGPWEPVLCILLNAAFTVLSLPTTLVCVLVALLYGVGRGLAICLAGLGLGMASSFLLARYCARDWLARRIGHTKLFARLEEGMRREGWQIVLFTRLLPINPYSFLNYAYGLTRISFWRYLLASLAGVTPNLLALLWTVHATGKLARGQMDWRILLVLFAGAGLFAGLAWLPKWLRRKPDFAALPRADAEEDDGEEPA